MYFVISFIAVIIALSVHEFMHAYAAYLQGDHTAEREGRLTLNPAAHVDPFGTILLPLLLSLAGLPPFGWAKPVPYNPYNLRNIRFGPTLVSVAGPLTNFALFIVSTLVFRSLANVVPVTNLLMAFLFTFATVNASLALFNIVPIPPLDGSKILYLWLHNQDIRRLIAFLERYGMFILLIYIYFDAPGLSQAYTWLMNIFGMTPFFRIYAGI